MRVDSTEAEAGKRSPARAGGIAVRPGLRLGEDAERAALEPQPRRRLGLVRGRGQRLVLEGQQDLDQPGRAGRGQHVADVRFDRADRALAWRPARAAVAPEPFQAIHLDGVADRCAGGVAFDQVNVPRAPACLLVGRLHGAKLAFGARGQQVSVDVVGQPDAANHRVDRIALPHRVAQALEHEEPGPFTDDQAVCLDVKWRRLAPGRERQELRKTHLSVERVGA